MTTKTTEQLLRDIFTELKQRPDFPVDQIREKVAIISTPRCGSTLFCDTLYNTGLIGQPMEWLNTRYMQAYGEVMGVQKVDLAGYLDFIFRKTTVNGVLAINFHVEQHRHLKQMGFDCMTLGFSRVYALARKNKINQAWSWAKALATDQWTSASVAKNNDVTIDGRSVLKVLGQLYEDECYYQTELASFVQQCFFYEEFSLMSPEPYQQILADLGYDDVTLTLKTTMKKQSGQQDDPGLAAFKAWLLPD